MFQSPVEIFLYFAALNCKRRLCLVRPELILISVTKIFNQNIQQCCIEDLEEKKPLISTCPYDYLNCMDHYHWVFLLNHKACNGRKVLRERTWQTSVPKFALGFYDLYWRTRVLCKEISLSFIAMPCLIPHNFSKRRREIWLTDNSTILRHITDVIGLNPCMQSPILEQLWAAWR